MKIGGTRFMVLHCTSRSWIEPSRLDGYASRMAGLMSEAQITCPNCGLAKVETMPIDACRHFYRCEGCGELLRPLPGDCCVFCSYADVQCPPKQLEAA